MTSSRYSPAAVNVAAVFVIFVGAERAEHAGRHDLGKADDGVERRAQFVAHVGEELGLGLVGVLGAGLFLGVLLRQVRELLRLDLQLVLAAAQVVDGGEQPLLAFDQLGLVHLERRDVGADRDVAAVLGAPLADLQPVAVVELRLEGAGAWNGRVLARKLGADDVLAARGHHVLVGGARRNRLVRQVVQVLEVGIAQHQPVFVVPQHEGFRDGLDRVAQPDVGGRGALDQRLLLGDVDRDADQVHARVAGLPHQLAAGAQPDPFAAGVQHAELVVDRLGLGVGELGCDLVEPDVVGMHQAAHFAERHQVVARRDPQNREHRMRPEDAAAGEVPVPQPAAAAIERRVDAASHRVVDRVGLACARGLPVKREAQDQQHEAGGRGQRDGQRGVGAPWRERIAAQLQRGHLAGAGEVAHRRKGALAVG